MRWPTVSFLNQNGKVETGDVAHQDGDVLTVRVERNPKKVPTPYGLVEMTGVYVEVNAKYLL